MLAACTFAAVAAPAPSSSGTDVPMPATSAPSTLAPVTVTASLNGTSDLDMPLHTTIVSREAIEKSPAPTLDQLLRTVPGFDFTGVPAAISDPTGQQTRMRGLGNAKVLVLLDGVPIMDPFYLTTQFYKVPLANIDHIEVVRGGTSSLYGSMAVAGMVDIITRRPHGDGGELVVAGGSRGAANLAWSQNLEVSNALALNLAVNRYRTDGYILTPKRYRWKFPGLRATSARDTNVELSAYFHPDADTRGFVRAGVHRQDELIGYRNGRNVQDNPDFALGLDRDLDADSALSLRAWAQSVHFTKFNGGSCYVQPVGRCLDSNARRQVVSDEVIAYYRQHGDLHYRGRGARLTYSRFVDGIVDSFQIGVDYRYLSATDAESFYATPSDPVVPQVLNATGLGRGRQTFGGVFAQVKASPLNSLQLTLSGRYDYWRNAGQIHSLTSAATGIATGGAVASSSKSAFDPSVGVHYAIDDAWSLRGAAYKAFRAPGFNNITRSYGTGPTTVANAHLAPETMTGWEAGSDYRNGTLALGATYFSYAITHMITTYRINTAAGAPPPVLALCSTSATQPNLVNCGGSTKYYSNNQDGRSRGVELEAHWHASEVLTLGANVTWTHSYLTRKAVAITTPLDVQLVGTPKKKAAVHVTWQPTERLTAYAQVYYIGPMLTDETTTRGVYVEQGGSTVYGASVRYAVNRSLSLAISVRNAFDKHYSENAYAVTQPWKRRLSLPRSFRVSATFRY